MLALRTKSALAASALTLALALGVAACGDDDDSGPPATTTAADSGLSLESCAPAEYGGEGDPEALIVSDLPMQGDSAERSRQQVEAIRVVLEQRDWQAGSTAVAFQACDDSIERTGLWDAKRCADNARAFVGDTEVLGVIGTYNSGCAAIEIPILGRGPVAMVSPGNTAVCLTQRSQICEDGQPDSLYPNGQRNYVRVVPNDAFQGAALASFAEQRGLQRPFVVYADDDPTSSGQALNFRGAAEQLGLNLAGFETWDPEARDYRKLFEAVADSGADSVVLAGLTEQNAGRVIADKVKFAGSNAKVPLIGFDGLAQQSTIDEAGAASEGMFASVPGRVPGELPEDGAALVASLEERLDDAPVEQFAPYAGEAAVVMLDAIADAGTNRDGVIDAVFATSADADGIVGLYDFQSNGDPTVGPITVLQAGESFVPVETISPDEDSVKAARG